MEVSYFENERTLRVFSEEIEQRCGMTESSLIFSNPFITFSFEDDATEIPNSVTKNAECRIKLFLTINGIKTSCSHSRDTVIEHINISCSIEDLDFTRQNWYAKGYVSVGIDRDLNNQKMLIRLARFGLPTREDISNLLKIWVYEHDETKMNPFFVKLTKNALLNNAPEVLI